MGGTILKEAPEPHYGVVVVGLDGPEGGAYDLGDLFKGKVMEDAEDQGGPLLLRKLRDGLLKLHLPLLLLQEG